MALIGGLEFHELCSMIMCRYRVMKNGQSESIPFSSPSVLVSVAANTPLWSSELDSGAVLLVIPFIVGLDGISDALGTSIGSDVVDVNVFSDRLVTESDFGFIT